MGEEAIEKHKIIDEKPLEEDIEETKGIAILIGVEAGQEIDSFHIILEEMIEVALGQDQVQEQVPIETEKDASSEGNMIICKGLSKCNSDRKGSDRTNAANA